MEATRPTPHQPMADQVSQAVEQEYALIIQQPGKPQLVLAKYLMLILNYRYGLEVVVVGTLKEALGVLDQYNDRLRSTFIIQNERLDQDLSLAPFNQAGRFPLFLFLPKEQLDYHQPLFEHHPNLPFCPWEQSFGRNDTSLQKMVEEAFRNNGIGDLFTALNQGTYDEIRTQVNRRLKNLHTLPTLPEISLRIIGIVNDPQSTMEDLEEVLISDPAIIHKLLQVVNSPIFGGRMHQGDWTLREAIVRLGRRKVGAIAQQIKLMNSLVKTDESSFDLRRFWEHSVACATIADMLYNQKTLPFKNVIMFNQYWTGALLHDIGKLVLGFFFPDHFKLLLSRMIRFERSFRDVELELDDIVTHEYLGRLLLLKSNAGEDLVEAVACHHSTGPDPSPLICLLHLANNFCAELGMGYLHEEKVVYSAAVLRTLKLKAKEVRALRQALAPEIEAQVKDLVERCLPSK